MLTSDIFTRIQFFSFSVLQLFSSVPHHVPGKVKNWNTEFSGTMLTSEIFTRIQFFSFSVLFPIMYLENWKTEKLNSQVLCWLQISSPEFSFSVFQFSSFSVLFPITYLENWKNWNTEFSGTMLTWDIFLRIQFFSFSVFLAVLVAITHQATHRTSVFCHNGPASQEDPSGSPESLEKAGLS